MNHAKRRLIKKDKLNLMDWLRVDRNLILVRVHSEDIITDSEYKTIKAIRDPDEAIRELLDKIYDKGEETCANFLRALDHNRIKETYPDLGNWLADISDGSRPTADLVDTAVETENQTQDGSRPTADVVDTAVETENQIQGDTNVPDYWDVMVGNSQCQVFPLKNNSQEYIDVQTQFSQTCRNGILKIERVQNPYLWRNYQIKKQAMDNKNGHQNNERQLFHGTSQPTINRINHNGFNRSYVGKNAAAIGNGAYFAVSASYSASNTYSVPDVQGQKYMYLCQVLTGDFTTGRQGMLVPPRKNTTTADLYDSVTDNPNRPSMFVVFNDIQAYPEYLITFK